jgi:hypothetical protein
MRWIYPQDFGAAAPVADRGGEGKTAGKRVAGRRSVG